MIALGDITSDIQRFLDAGGPVMGGIVLLTFALWTLLYERFFYFNRAMKSDVQQALTTWEARPERKSWEAHQIRYLLISRTREKINRGLPMIKTLIALCPLLGLLGTVTGMIEVFNVMAVTGGGDAKAMAEGVSKATIPTMAGMVVALSGMFGMTFINRTAARESLLLEDHLTSDH
ncbi:MotA/TolQ/ExbB proton channel family protein [Parendozoicomonas haliclonae]|uniref:Colicin uptake protein TolQ n=1 Tax=Parendozoicomonas haliclonae TaxID=1960125 RepID=A0A1X7APB9_9GAMM|nr:MotA/TolQ/ExbB proton channel family protein [Parendozoicomonas haliclonae]SMA49929.1 colicin uptake protein TolQ [Parendozoicomonas haliclonae]